jgi:hypothetical protein
MTTIYIYAEFHHEKCHIVFIVIVNVVILSVMALLETQWLTIHPQSYSQGFNARHYHRERENEGRNIV